MAWLLGSQAVRPQTASLLSRGMQAARPTAAAEGRSEVCGPMLSLILAAAHVHAVRFDRIDPSASRAQALADLLSSEQ